MPSRFSACDFAERFGRSDRQRGSPPGQGVMTGTPTGTPIRIARAVALAVLVGSAAFAGLTRAPVDGLANGAAGNRGTPVGAAPQPFDTSAPALVDGSGPRPAEGAPHQPAAHATLTDDVVAAVGRLNHAGHRLLRHCTAFLSGPQQVTTARHCVTDIAADSFHLLSGYDRTSWREHLQPQRVVTPNEARDVAHLCLAETAISAPFATVPRAVAIGEPVTVVHYASPAVHRQQRQSCAVVGRLRTNEFVIDCKLEAGASGAPVMQVGPGGAVEVVGVVSKAGKSYAVAVPLMASELTVCEARREPELSLRAEVR